MAEPKKFCPDCGHHLSVAMFTRDKRRSDGLAFYCRDHARQRLRESKARRQGPPRSRHPLDRVVPVGWKWCPDCDTVKRLSDFPRSRGNKSGHHSYCKPCHNARGKATLESVGGSRTYHLKRRYGISAADADLLLVEQGGLCAICKAAPAVHVDHHHATGAVRALLCFNCNGGLGQFRDDPGLLYLAAFYLEHHGERQALQVLVDAASDGPEGASRPVSPPVGSDRRPGGRGTTSRTSGRSSRSRRRTQAREDDG
jgi:hypothetical protein